MLFLMYVIVRNSLSRSRSGKQSFLTTKAPGRKRRKLLLQNRYILRKPLCILCVPRASVVQKKLTAESAKNAEEMQRKENLCASLCSPCFCGSKKIQPQRTPRTQRRYNAKKTFVPLRAFQPSWFKKSFPPHRPGSGTSKTYIIYIIFQLICL